MALKRVRPPDHAGSREQLEAVAARAGRGLADLAGDIRGAIELRVPALREPAGGKSLLETSVRQNIDTVLGILEHCLEPGDVHAPSGAVAYARALAKRGVSTLALIRAYRIGQRQFLTRMIDDLVKHGVGEQSEARAIRALVAGVSDYVDSVVEQLIVEYAKAREEWLDPNTILAARVRSVLYDKALKVEAAGEHIRPYPLRDRHVGLELWIQDAAPGEGGTPSLAEAGAAITAAAGHTLRTLFVPTDAASASIWLALGTRTTFDAGLITSALARLPGAYVAHGDAGLSLAGFRRTHEQALMAKAVAVVRNPPRARLTPYAEVAPIAALSHDLDATRTWIAEALGALAADDERNARLRRTVRVFFGTGGSYATTAEKLGLHRNTTQYRVRAAEERRGRPFSEGRLDVELALLACYWFGPAVLQKP